MATWNHLSFSQLALDSYFRNTNARLLVVDNASTDGTVEYLRKLKKTGAIDLIENSENRGISPVINQGIKWAGDNDYCFLSNDIVFGKNWLKNLQDGVYEHKELGGASPYTTPEATYDDFANMEFRENYRRNYWPRLRKDPDYQELKEIIDELHMGDFQEFTEIWDKTRKDVPPLYEWMSMVMYLKRSTIDKVGLFDERFIPSNWEDLDYMVRMNREGLYRATIASSYIFHWSNISNRNEFGDNTGEYKKEMTENEKRFHRKWRIFLPPDKVVRGVEDGDKYKENSGFRHPWPVSDSEHNRMHGSYYTWEEWEAKTGEKCPNP